MVDPGKPERGRKGVSTGRLTRPSSPRNSTLTGDAMKGGQNFRDLQQKKEEEAWVKPQACIVCQKTIGGAYAQHSDGWTCSSKCMKVRDTEDRFPGHSAEDFERKL